MKMHMYVSGQRIDLEHPQLDDFNIDDIAHNLALLPRFCGNTSRPISVAEHSMLVMEIVEANNGDPAEMLQALLHDATEAYIGDIPAPVKQLIPEVRDYEKKVLWPVIAKRFDLEPELSTRVQKADWVAFFVEAKSLCFANDIEDWSEHDKYGQIADDWMTAYGALNPKEMPHPGDVSRAFLNCYHTLQHAIEHGITEEEGT